jgi:hypothetical protein
MNPVFATFGVLPVVLMKIPDSETCCCKDRYQERLQSKKTTLKLEEAISYETLTSIHQSIRCHIPEYGNLYPFCFQNTRYICYTI